MTIGLFLFALGIVLTLRANIGFAPWDVFHVGIANTLGLTIGTVSIAVGLILIIVIMLMGEKIGFGTVWNMLLIGLFLDLILKIDIIPKMENLFSGSIMLFAGLFIIAVGSYFYLGAAFGAGPRDGLMVALARKTKIPVGVCRSLIELAVTIAGWFLGGMVGLGTVMSVIGIGFCVQLIFRLFKFDVTAVKHETFKDTLAFLKTNINARK